MSRVGWAVLLVSVALFTSAGQAGAAVNIGFNDDFPIAKADLSGESQGTTLNNFVADNVDMGVNVERIAIYWSSAQPSGPQNNPTGYLNGFKPLYDALEAHGIKMIFVVTQAPCWAAPNATCPGGVTSPAVAPVHDQDYANFALKVAQAFPDALGIEVWNEPNLGTNWGGAADAASYAGLLTATYQTINHTTTVTTGGLANYAHGVGAQDAGGNVTYSTFLDTLYAQAAGNFDAINYHAYAKNPAMSVPVVNDDDNNCIGNPDPTCVMTQVTNRILAVRAAHSGTQPLWLTETGGTTVHDNTGDRANGADSNYGTWWPEQAASGTIDGQDKLLPALVTWIRAQLAATNLQVGIFNFLIEPIKRDLLWNPPPNPGMGFGVVEWQVNPALNTRVYRNKPAYAPLAAAIEAG
jgi:hypothetical protein